MEAVHPGGHAQRPESSQGCYFWADQVSGSPGYSRTASGWNLPFSSVKLKVLACLTPNRSFGWSLAASRSRLHRLLIPQQDTCLHTLCSLCQEHPFPWCGYTASCPSGLTRSLPEAPPPPTLKLQPYSVPLPFSFSLRFPHYPTS